MVFRNGTSKERFEFLGWVSKAKERPLMAVVDERILQIWALSNKRCGGGGGGMVAEPRSRWRWEYGGSM